MLDGLYQENKAYRYSIIHSESNQIVGSCGYKFLDFENLEAKIDYDIGKEYWGNGFASEAILSLLDYAFNTPDFNRIKAKVDPENSN